MKNILFLVTGMTPQIITETVWALACDPNNDNKWIPDEIRVLSTEDGLNQIRSRLFDDGVFAQFKADYPVLQNIQFDTNSLILIKDRDQVLSDLKTPLDNELTADLICQTVREFTSDDDVCLHVSIAGGRKTMGFYAGYALSLYGRSQDKMSHVLAQEDYEGAKGFYYPTPQDYYVEHREGKKRLNAKNAKIWLADIPFVRLRSSLGDNAVIHQTFSDVVSLLNVSLSDLRLIINAKKRTIEINDISCKLPPKEFSLYLLVVKLLKNNEVLYYPSKDIDDDTIDDKHQKLFNKIYGKYKAKDDMVIDNSRLSTTMSNIKRKMIISFGVDIFNKVSIQDIGHGYGLILSPEQIIIEEM